MISEFILVITIVVSGPQIEVYNGIYAPDGEIQTWTSPQACRAFVVTEYRQTLDQLRKDVGRRSSVTPGCMEITQEVI